MAATGAVIFFLGVNGARGMRRRSLRWLVRLAAEPEGGEDATAEIQDDLPAAAAVEEPLRDEDEAALAARLEAPKVGLPQRRAGVGPLLPTAEHQPPASLAALDAFAAGHLQAGPISQIAARMGAETRVAPAAAAGVEAGPEIHTIDEEDMAPTALAARRTRVNLTALAAVAGTDPRWAQRFWRWCSGEHSGGRLTPEVLSVLRAYGYLAPQTRPAPGASELATSLQALESSVMAPPPSLLAGENEYNRWSAALPANFRTAARDIGRNIRSSGALSIRQWIQGNQSQSWLDLSQTPRQPITPWPTRRRMRSASRSWGRRTSLSWASAISPRLTMRSARWGYSGAQRIRAIAALGSEIDLAPEWLVAEATTFSKAQYQRAERDKG